MDITQLVRAVNKGLFEKIGAQLVRGAIHELVLTDKYDCIMRKIGEQLAQGVVEGLTNEDAFFTPDYEPTDEDKTPQTCSGGDLLGVILATAITAGLACYASDEDIATDE